MQATPRTAICQVSCASTSAAQTLSAFCSRAVTDLTTCRLPLSEWFSGKRMVRRKTPTCIDRLHAVPADAADCCYCTPANAQREQPPLTARVTASRRDPLRTPVRRAPARLRLSPARRGCARRACAPPPAPVRARRGRRARHRPAPDRSSARGRTARGRGGRRLHARYRRASSHRGPSRCRPVARFRRYKCTCPPPLLPCRDRLGHTEIALEESEDLLPAIDRLLWPVAGTIDGEEAVARAIVAVELVRFAEALEHFLCAIDLVGIGVGIFVAEDAKQRAGELLGEVDRRNGPQRVELRRIIDDDVTAPAIDCGIDAAQAAGGKVRVSPARAEADHADLAAGPWLRAQESHRSLDIAHHLIIRDAAGSTHARGEIVGAARPGAAVQMRRGGRVPVVSQLAHDLFGPLVPAGHVVDDDDAGARPHAQRTREVRFNEVAVVSAHCDRFCQHTFVRIHRCRLLYALYPSRNDHAPGGRARPARAIYSAARSGRKKARISSTSSAGSSMAAKWPPRGIGV